MMRDWLTGIGFGFVLAAAGCSTSSSSSGAGGSGPSGNVNIVASEDGTVEVLVDGEALFALAPGGPVARNFFERPVGIGTITFERSGEEEDTLEVVSVANDQTSARVEYASADGTRTATLTAMPIDDESSEFRLEVVGPAADSIAVGIRCDAEGTFHGFGEQYNATNQRGEAFELLVNEQGNGRDGGPGVSVGNEHTTYFPMPYYMDARGFGAWFDTAYRVDVDLCATDEDIAWVEVISGAAVQWRVFHGPTPLDVIRQLGDLLGRPTQPPEWAYYLWMAGQGGRDVVLDEVARIEAADLPASAMWVQDWGGIRINPDGGFGVQYVWNADGELYPGFASMVSDLQGEGYRFLTYVNPFIVDPNTVVAEDSPLRFAPRFDAMEDEAALLLNSDGATFLDAAVPNIPQQDAHPDFSNPATVPLITELLEDALRETGVDGWMADFGEWVPLMSVPQDGSDPVQRRNTFPVDWQRANRDALEAVRGDDWVMFARSGFSRVQDVAQIHWVGDQETNWGVLDGLPTVVPAMLNLGLAGQPFVTHDIAGFARGDGPSTKELFQRWTELGSFTPIMRTHDGADKVNNWRWSSDAETTDHFRKFTFVHCALADDFMALADEAELSGAPILRHMMLVFPSDSETWDLSDQYMIGDDLLVAPVLEEGAVTRSVYFPAGTWYDVWTGETVEGGQRLTVDAPIGTPPVYALGADREDIRGWESLVYEDCR
jgi:alpha-glucosidase